MLPAYRPPPPRLDHLSADGEDMNVLARTVRRAAGDLTFERILRLERNIRLLEENIAWREAHLAERAVRWVRSRMIFTAVMAATLIGTALWFRYTDDGRSARIGWVEGGWAQQGRTGSPFDQPHWLTSDMTRAEIDALNARAETDRLRREAKDLP